MTCSKCELEESITRGAEADLIGSKATAWDYALFIVPCVAMIVLAFSPLFN